ncbi:A24 family peptidase [Vallitalea sp.]|jgi:prepilin peptidase CpaA|uniref:A24 family peptidase n=1 Tax=Vallitalea sp. TaxID=1882829 RepID=UPI0025D8DC62|nr:prepilin peptidase [Vallitalea sp.]MCT4685995.1 prepilin peptidase [Vallitalea sp.]
MIPIIKYVLVCILLILVIYTDTKNYAVKNSAILFFAAAGLIVNCVELGFTGLVNWLMGISLPILVLFVLFIVRMLGAGDIKLIGVIGGLLGLDFLMKSSLYMLIAAGFMSLVKMVVERNLIIRLKHFFNFVHNIINNKQIGIYDELNKEDKSHVIRLSYAIGAGIIYQILFELKIFG